MISNIGHYFLILTLIILVFSIFINNYKYKIYFISLIIFIINSMFLLLIYYYINNNLNLYNIYIYSNSTLSIFFKFCGCWGNHEGSLILLLWLFSVLLIYNLYILNFSIQIQIEIIKNALYVLLLICVYIYITSNPFIYLNFYNIDGIEINPILQDPILSIHPPIIYVGYLITIYIYIYTIIFEKNKKTYYNYFLILKKQVYFAWLTLTIGMLLGSWWAYHELGWGGWWFWDPVENISLLPWILLLILIHLFKINQFINNIKLISFFSFLTGFSSLFGIILVRSGLLTSIHTFANEFSKSLFLFLFLFIYLLFYLKSVLNKIKFKTKLYSFFIKINKNNLNLNYFYLNFFIILLILIFLFIFYGTISPVIFKYFFKFDISIGNLFYEDVLIPIILATLILFLFYYFNNLNYYSIFFLLLLSFFIVYYIYNSIYTINNIIFIYLISCILCTIIYINKWTISNISHFLIILFLFSIIFSTTFDLEIIKILYPGDLLQLYNIKILFKEINNYILSNSLSIYAEFQINLNNYFFSIFPEKKYYLFKELYTAKSIIITSWTNDIYMLFTDGNYRNGWIVRIKYTPMMSILWLTIICLFFIFTYRLYKYKQKYIYKYIWI